MRAALLAAALAAAAPALADQDRDIAACLSTADIEVQIAGCTALIEAGELPPVRMARAFNNRAHAHLRAGDAEASRTDLERALELNPGFFLARHNLGVALDRLGDHAAAVAAYSAALDLTPDPGNTVLTHAATLQNRGHSYRQMEDWAAAVADFRASHGLTDGLADPVTGLPTDVHYWIGAAEARLGNLDPALAALNTHLMIHPVDTAAWLERGYVLADAGMLRAALADLDAYNASEPGDPAGLFQRAWVRGELGDIAGELADLDRALAAGGTDPVIWNNRAVALCRLGRGAEAEADWLTYWEKAPDAAGDEQEWLAAEGLYDGPRDGRYSDALRAALAAYAAACPHPEP